MRPVAAGDFANVGAVSNCLASPNPKPGMDLCNAVLRFVCTFLLANNACRRSAMRAFIGWLALLNILILFSLGRNLRPHIVSAAAPTISPTPTVDRLAQPTLPPSPGQADLGSQAF